MKFCTECGAPLSDANKFCANCGARITSGESQTSAPAADPVQPATESTAPLPAPKDTSGLPPAWMPVPVQPGTGVTLEQNVPPPPISSESDEPRASIPPPPSFMPPPVRASFGGTTDDRPSGLSGIDEDWKMSNLGPPLPPKRRLWLWIPLGVIAAVLLCCLTFIVLSETVLEDTFDRWATEIATDSTEEAVGP